MNGCACGMQPPVAMGMGATAPADGGITIPVITWKTTVLPGIVIVAGAALVGGLVYYAAKRK